jgi:outer membrane protein OmpA-like peptidoglycan-associated protein
MNTMNMSGTLTTTLVATAVSAILLAACATAPGRPDAASEPREKLTQLQGDPNLASRAPQALEAAEAAVRLAEQPEADQDLVTHRVYLADRKVDTARADAQTRYAEDQRAVISSQRDQARLDARTHEANVAEGQVAVARGEADVANQAAARSAQHVSELQLQVQALQAKPTERGLVLTLGDSLFSSGRANLQPGANGNLTRLVAFLGRYPDRTVVIEGHTDSIGSEDYNQGLSERRAGAVKSYLLDQGVSPMRLTSSGKGASDPVAGNDTEAGRQRNRRVEVIISEPATASP